MKLDWLKPEKVVVLWHIAVIGLSAVYAEVQGDITFQAANNQTRVPDPLPGHKQILDDGHDHSECGYNTAVKPWMQHNLAIFNVGKEASDRMARSGVSAQTGDTVSAEPSPIRIHTEFQLTDMEDYSKRHFLKYLLVPRMVAEIRRRVLVKKPIQGNFRIPRYCSLYYVRDDESYICAEIANQEYCSSPEVGIRHNVDLMDGYTTCKDIFDSSCTAYEGGPGVKDTDFVLYVAANDVGYCQQGRIVAFAGTCALDLETNRPMAGFANFCPGNLNTDPASFQDLLETAIHEALHALFFSELLFPYYLDENGQKRKDVVRLDSEGHKVVITPTVKQAVRDHFACDTMDGAPLENEGGGGTAGNHWESRFFKGELMDGMSGAPNERAVFSAITMALLEDTGWYSANWGLQGNLGFGKHAGCEFAAVACAEGIQVPERVRPWICQTGSQEDQCSWDLKAVGKCHTELLLDGCSTPVAYRNMHCMQASLSKDRENPDSWMWGYGYGPRSRCLKEIGPVTRSPGDGYKYTKFAGDWNLECYNFKCQNGQLLVLVGEHELPCPTGQEVDLTSIGYASGRLGPCPSNEEMCRELSCPGLCSGNGDCMEGTCYCALGFAGDDCSQHTCFANTCSQGFHCNSVLGVCEPSSKASSVSDCAAALNGSDTASWGAVSYLLDLSRDESSSMSSCYTGIYDETGKPPRANELMEAPPIIPSSTASAPLQPEAPAATSKPREAIWESQEAASPAQGAHSPETIQHNPAEESKTPQPQPEAKASPADQEVGSRIPALPLTGKQGDLAILQKVRVRMALVQLDGSRQMSTMQADRIKKIIADSAGTDKDSITFMDLVLPEPPALQYELEAQILSQDAARVATSLRKAYSYGILRSRIRDEARMECLSAEVKAENVSRRQNGTTWVIGVSLLVLLFLVMFLACLFLAVCYFQRASVLSGGTPRVGPSAAANLKSAHSERNEGRRQRRIMELYGLGGDASELERENRTSHCSNKETHHNADEAQPIPSKQESQRARDSRSDSGANRSCHQHHENIPRPSQPSTSRGSRTLEPLPREGHHPYGHLLAGLSRESRES